MRTIPLAPVERPIEIGGPAGLPPREPCLAPGELHVWVADLRRVEDTIRRVLDDGERQREREIAGERERTVWARSRGVLRELIARYGGADARSLRIETQASGKPLLAGDRRGQGALHFN